ncbi:protein serine phosphatase with GAF(s) sensor(s) [Coriobacterium glomerans PW2]|uniref:Protein serine phosphatase with GAF(S) sensor(S) n=1 Tax=Coriobacterium glomerans (strain ATCC 49209 / DSM 20642 / JCM 10262 / PW2) TaxID=700015 RepID=F2N8G2_CORGP|nr:GAF domain-containing SpoIIE family protein phosphatase [Coriobacterium glomerans]AEB07345.1 protein serine phosphatase with GAF(s) sensor(s) [Coriobacterium glomerans PW2]
MDAMPYHDAIGLLKLVEMTSDFIAVCAHDGTILHINHQLLDLLSELRPLIVGSNIKDLLFSVSFERAADHELPFPLDGSDTKLTLKLFDGSFTPVLARAVQLSSGTSEQADSGRILVVMQSLKERYARDVELNRALCELQSANKRLSGIISVIVESIGATDLAKLLDTVLNELVSALDADGSAIYFSESTGFRLRGVSRSLSECDVPVFLPYGVGIPTYVMRKQRSCRLSVLPAIDEDDPRIIMYDHGDRQRFSLRIEETLPFRSLIAVPVFYGTQVLGVIELGWSRPKTQRAYDVKVLEVICEFLSIQLVGLVNSLRSKRMTKLIRSINHIRDTLFEFGVVRKGTWPKISSEMRRVLSCDLYEFKFDADNECWALDVNGRFLDIPGSIDEMFFSTRETAARPNPGIEDYLAHAGGAQSTCSDDLERVRLARFNVESTFGKWLKSHGLPGQGIFVDPGPQLIVQEPPTDARTADDSASAAQTPVQLGLEHMYVLLRDESYEPLDDMEYDYMLWLAHEYEIYLGDATHKKQQGCIAQTLQVGMRNALGNVPGLTTDSLYSSATRQALVGGDFYTLIHLPDDCAVMVVGDVSGKGVEAASMSALVKTALTAYAWEGADPDGMCRSLNSMLMSFSRVETFASMFIAKIDLRRGRAWYCSAGSPPALLIRSSILKSSDEARSCTPESCVLDMQSGVVGAFETMSFKGGSFEFSAGDILFMYTDGAIEARNSKGEFFGEQRLRDHVMRHVHQGLHGLCQTILDALDEFTDSTLDDDIALVALRFDRDKEPE